MKKFLAAILAAIMMFGIVGCAVAEEDEFSPILITDVTTGNKVIQTLKENGATVGAALCLIGNLALDEGMSTRYAITINEGVSEMNDMIIFYGTNATGVYFSNSWMTILIKASPYNSYIIEQGTKETLEEYGFIFLPLEVHTGG